jgi:hypothetical protein
MIFSHMREACSITSTVIEPHVPSDFKVHFLEYRWTVNHRKWPFVRWRA